MREKWQGSVFYVVLVTGLIIASIMFAAQIEIPARKISPASPRPMMLTETAQRCIASRENGILHRRKKSHRLNQTEAK
jgi:hypothetical protein